MELRALRAYRARRGRPWIWAARDCSVLAFPFEVILMSRLLPVSAAGLGLALLAFASPADAHIRLLSPAARYEITGFDTGIKSCPCGLGDSNRSCNLATDSSDPDRSENVLRVEAGSQLVLRFDEYVDHTGSFRVAFDPDGADMADFNDNILVPIVADPAGTGGQIWEIPVTVPDEPCDNCTLQLIQAMHGNTTVPVEDPAPLSTYYTCVDLEIVPAGTLGEEPTGAAGASSMPDGAAGSSAMPGAAGSGSTTGGMNAGNNNSDPIPLPPTGDNTGSATPPAGMTGSGTPGGTPSTGVGMLNPGSGSTAAPAASSSESSDSGCALGVSSSSSRWAALGLAGALAVLVRRRRRAA